MAGGGPISIEKIDSLRVASYHSKLNFYVFVVALIAASGGLLFGYDIGITGGVESMPSFQQQFFPDVYARTTSNSTDTNPYCTYEDHSLALFTSSLFLAGLVASLFASSITRKFGRKVTMAVASLSFLLGAGLNAGAQNLGYLIAGRIFLGIGIGNGNQVVPLYLTEVAPYKLRGMLNQLFQMATTIGIFVAQLINYGVQDWDQGWRLSLGLAAVPALILLFGSIILPESPNSLVERGKEEKARVVLTKLRGTDDIDTELEDIKDATEIANKTSLLQSWGLMFTRAYAPMLIVTVCISMFQQLTGINSIMFYVPVIFNSLGSGKSAALMNTCIIGAVNVVATLVAIFTCDKLGRRFLFIEGGIQMITTLGITAAVLGIEFGKYTNGKLPDDVAIGVCVVICVFVAGFAWSWGPLGWLVPSEIQTLETRAAGMSAAVTINFAFSFLIGQVFLSMLCAMQWGVFLFFAGWVCVATIFVFFLLPETKGVPVERMSVIFANHPVWRHVMGPSADDINSRFETHMEGVAAKF